MKRQTHATENAIVDAENCPASPSVRPEPGGKALFVGAHPDDIELGAGGLVQRLLRANYEVWFLIMTSDSGADKANLRRNEALAGALCLGVAPERVAFFNLPDRFLGQQSDVAGRIRGWCQEVFGAKKPKLDLVVTHSTDDSHGDHRACANFVAEAFRLPILSFSVFTSTTATFNANTPICVNTTPFFDTKMQAFLCHKSQLASLHEGTAVEALSKQDTRYAEETGFRYSESFEMRLPSTTPLASLSPIVALADYQHFFRERLIPDLRSQFPGLEHSAIESIWEMWRETHPEASQLSPFGYRTRNLSTPPLDLWTPGPSEDETLQHYEPLVGKSIAKQLWLLSQDAITAVSEGDFARQLTIGEQLDDLGLSIPYLRAEGSYLKAEALRLLGDVARTPTDSAMNRAKSLEQYQIASDLFPTDPRSLRGIGRLLELDGNYDEALILFQRAKGLCLMGEPARERRADLAHETLRTARHLVHCVLEIRQSSPNSNWNRQHKRHELEGLVFQCENLHVELMPMFRAAEAWSQIEWFMGLVFIAKAWSRLEHDDRARKSLAFALHARRRMMSEMTLGPLSKIEVANLNWWIAVASERTTLFDRQALDSITVLADAVRRDDRAMVKQMIDELVFPWVPPWDRLAVVNT